MNGTFWLKHSDIVHNNKGRAYTKCFPKLVHQTMKINTSVHAKYRSIISKSLFFNFLANIIQKQKNNNIYYYYEIVNGNHLNLNLISFALRMPTLVFT